MEFDNACALITDTETTNMRAACGLPVGAGCPVVDPPSAVARRHDVAHTDFLRPTPPTGAPRSMAADSLRHPSLSCGRAQLPAKGRIILVYCFVDLKFS